MVYVFPQNVAAQSDGSHEYLWPWKVELVSKGSSVEQILNVFFQAVVILLKTFSFVFNANEQDCLYPENLYSPI